MSPSENVLGLYKSVSKLKLLTYLLTYWGLKLTYYSFTGGGGGCVPSQSHRLSVRF